MKRFEFKIGNCNYYNRIRDAVVVNFEGKMKMICCSMKYGIVVVDVSEGKVEKTISSVYEPLSLVVMNSFLISSHGNGNLVFWEFSTMEKKREIHVHPMGCLVLGMSVTKDSDRIITSCAGSNDGGGLKITRMVDKELETQDCLKVDILFEALEGEGCLKHIILKSYPHFVAFSYRDEERDRIYLVDFDNQMNKRERPKGFNIDDAHTALVLSLDSYISPSTQKERLVTGCRGMIFAVWKIRGELIQKMNIGSEISHLFFTLSDENPSFLVGTKNSIVSLVSVNGQDFEVDEKNEYPIIFPQSMCWVDNQSELVVSNINSVFILDVK